MLDIFSLKLLLMCLYLFGLKPKCEGELLNKIIAKESFADVICSRKLLDLIVRGSHDTLTV